VAGRENAKIHYWLTDKDGKKVFEHTDTIRQTFMENGHEKSVGTLARPFAGKVSDRLKGVKLAPEGVSGQ
jgi:FKBP-type peptidyl-prolyl cis-trans isomerase 2